MTRASRARALVALLLLSSSLARGADVRYVIEQLVVGISSSADGNGERVATVKSGEQVQLIERSGDAAHVRLTDGRDGWLRASYLTSDEPLRLRLEARDNEVAQLKTSLGTLQTQLAAARADSGAHAAPPPRAGAEEVAAAPAGGWFAPPADPPQRRIWPWAAAAALIALPLGFLCGWRVLDRQIRRKYGGLRIY